MFIRERGEVQEALNNTSEIIFHEALFPTNNENHSSFLPPIGEEIFGIIFYLTYGLLIDYRGQKFQ